MQANTNIAMINRKLNFLHNLDSDSLFQRDTPYQDENVNYQNIQPSNITLNHQKLLQFQKERRITCTYGATKTSQRKSEATLENEILTAKRKQSECQEFKVEDYNSDFFLMKRVESYGSESTQMDSDSTSQISHFSSPYLGPQPKAFSAKDILAFQNLNSSENPKGLYMMNEGYTTQEQFIDFNESEAKSSIEQILAAKGKREFVFDPENGGGRRRRVKQVSRLEMLMHEEKQKQQVYRELELDFDEELRLESDSRRPMGIREDLYEEDSDAKFLNKMDDCRHPDLNTISHNTLAELMKKKNFNFMILDCRFDYEYKGGHIQGAFNFNSPESIEDFFFQEKSRIENLMQSKTILIFHCEFSQQRGPKLYRTMRDLDRRLNLEFYPQLFYPEIYILEGGYKEFYLNHADLCEGTYIQMEDANHKKECKEKYSKVKQLHKQYSTKEARNRLMTQ